jgi:hypothetical protein
MRRYIIALALAVAPIAAVAQCVTNTTILPNGRIVTCTTCCAGNHCTTNCF